MLDRDKISKGLQCIIDGTVRCESCGYAIDKHGHYSCQQNCVSDALALLKEQEAKPVKVVKNAYNHEFYYCPRCDRSFYDLYYGKPKFCDKCGQAVKWENE